MQAGKGQIDQAEQNMFPSVLCRQADLEVEGRVQLKAEGGAERGKRVQWVKQHQCVSRDQQKLAEYKKKFTMRVTALDII